MALLYARTYERFQPGSGSYATDLVSSSGKVWSDDYWVTQGILSTGRPPIMIPYRGDTYIVGAYSRVLVRQKQTRSMVPAGIKPPPLEIAVVEGADTGGSTGAALCFTTFLHKEGDAVLAESERSNIVELDGMTGKGYVWSNLNAPHEKRVTHIRGYRSMDGADYALAWEAPVGISTITENVLTQNLLQIAPDIDQRWIPPTGLFYGVEFAGSMWYARNAQYPHRLWRSVPGYPQYVDPNNYGDTLGRETITAIARTPGQELIVFCVDRSYIVRITGDGDSDWRLDRLDSSVGCINNRGIVEIHRRLWFPGLEGFWTWDNSTFHFMGHDIKPFWVEDRKENALAFGTGFAIDDREGKNLLFFTPRRPASLLEGDRCGTVVYVAAYEDCEPAMGGQEDQPVWSLDNYGRRASAALYDANGNIQIGWCDGEIRNPDPTNGDDDGDPLGKDGLIRHGVMYFNTPGDDPEGGGKKLQRFWAHVESEATPWVLNLLMGDEQVYRQMAPDNDRFFWRRAVAASRYITTKVIDGVTKVLQSLPKGTHYWADIEKLSGSGLCVGLRFPGAIGLAYRGYGGTYSPSRSSRPQEFETGFTMLFQWRILGESEWRELPFQGLMRSATFPYILEMRITATYTYGPEASPITYSLSWSGTGAPAGTNSTLASPAYEEIVQYPLGGDQRAFGRWNLSGTDAAGLAAQIDGPVDLSAWEILLEYQVDGSGWSLLDLSLAQAVGVGLGHTLSLRYRVYGTNLPLTLEIVGYEDGSYLASVDVEAAGASGTTYGDYDEVFSVAGEYQVTGTLTDSQGRTIERAVTVVVTP